MARIPYVDPKSASPEVRETLAAFPPLNIFRTVAHAESAFLPFMRFGAAVLTQGELDDVLRELAILRVASLTGAEYEWVQHAAIAETVGARAEQVAAIERGEIEADCLDDTERLVLRFATEIVEDHGASESTVAAATERFSPREIVELTLAAGWYQAIAGLMNTVAIDLDPAAGADVLESARRRAT